MHSQQYEDDIRLVLDGLHRFSEGVIAPHVERPEQVLSPRTLESVVEEAQSMGLLSRGEPCGYGVWEQGDGPVSLSLQLLTTLGNVSAGVSMRFHQFALTRYLLDALAISGDCVADTALSLTGVYGMGRAALPSILSNKEPLRDDIEFIRHWFNGDAATPLVFIAAPNWRWLLHPSIDDKGHLTFVRYSREQLLVEEMENSHGLNELAVFCCHGFSYTSQQSSTNVMPAQSKDIYIKSLQYNALAMMAIMLGSVQHAYTIASEYAAIRKQGGELINRHPAVQLLLGKLRVSIDSASSTLAMLGRENVTCETLSTVFSARASFHQPLCDAANAAMQVCGGIGYMQDTGIEKIVRDCNALRIMDGTASELMLFVAEWERLHD